MTLDCINSLLDWGSGNWSSLNREVWVYNPNVSSCWFSFVACGSPRTGPLLLNKWSLPLLRLVRLGCQDEPEGTHDFMQHFWHIFARYTSFSAYKSNPISWSLSWKATFPEVQLGIWVSPYSSWALMAAHKQTSSGIEPFYNAGCYSFLRLPWSFITNDRNL